MMFNVPVEPIRALNPSQLSKRTILLRNGYVGRDPRRSRTARGVTALTRMSVAHVKLNRYPFPPARPRRWTTIDSPVAGKVVRQSPAPAWHRGTPPDWLTKTRLSTEEDRGSAVITRPRHPYLDHVLHQGALYPGGLPDPALR